MSDSVVPLWFHFTSLFGVMLLASYLCGKRLAEFQSLADAMAEAIEDQIDTCDASMDEQIAVKNYRTTIKKLTGGKDE